MICPVTFHVRFSIFLLDFSTSPRPSLKNIDGRLPPLRHVNGVTVSDYYEGCVSISDFQRRSA